MADIEQAEDQVELGWGNNKKTVWLWSFLGIVFASTSIVAADNINDTVKSLIAFAIILVAGMVFAIAYYVRETRFMRKPITDFKITIALNLIVSTITIAISLLNLLHKKHRNALIIQMMVSFSVFCLMEVAKPVYDFGLSQFMLRLSVQMVIAIRPKPFAAWIVGSIAMLVVATVWQVYNLKAMKEGDAAKDRRQEFAQNHLIKQLQTDLKKYKRINEGLKQEISVLKARFENLEKRHQLGRNCIDV